MSVINSNSKIIFSDNTIANKYKITLILINLNFIECVALIPKIIEYKYGLKKLESILFQFPNNYLEIEFIKCGDEILDYLTDFTVGKIHYIKRDNFLGLYQLKVFSTTTTDNKTYFEIKNENLKKLNPVFEKVLTNGKEDETCQKMVEIGKVNETMDSIEKENKILLGKQKIGKENFKK